MTYRPNVSLKPWFHSARALLAASTCATVLAAVPAFAAPADPPAKAVDASTVAAAVSATTSEEAAPAQAAPASPILEFFEKVEVSGLVDAYYHYNFNEPVTGTMTPLRNFDVRHNQFSLSYVELALGKTATADDRIGFRFDLGYGQLANIFNADPLDGNAALNVQQGYVSYMAPIGSGLTIDFGKFVTPIGTEPTEAHLNNNYSRTWLYALGPYYHVGARLGYTVNDKLALGGSIVNGWNATGDNNSGKTVSATATVTPGGGVTFVQSVMVGPEQTDSDDVRTLSDTNLAVAFGDNTTAGFNYAYNKDTLLGEDVSWQGLALYFRQQVTPVFAVAPRFGWFDDGASLVSGAVQELKEFTLTGELKHPSGLIFRAEYRRDWSDVDFFTKDGAAVDSQNTFSFAFVYAFSSKN